MPSQNVVDGPTGCPSALTPIGAGNCSLGPWPTMAAMTGAKIAMRMMRTITATEIIAARSRRSRS